MNSLSNSPSTRRCRHLAAGLAATILLVALGGGEFLAAPAAFGAEPRPDPPPAMTRTEIVSTFSIVAFDPETGDLGVAVQSKFFAVGRVVPFAAAGVGAVATQSYANTTYGPRGLEMLRDGRSPAAVVEALLADDDGRAQRQVGIVDATGSAANFTGDACLSWAGGRSGANYAAQGNILAGPQVVDAMASTFESADGDLASRLLVALAAGQAAGGDARGRQSAALLVVREGAGYGGYDDRYIDLRVEDHERPIEELSRLLDIHHGREADDRARRLLDTAGVTTAADRGGLLRDAVEVATVATGLDPANGWLWLTLAEARLAEGDVGAAAEAGRRALLLDPWIKTAVLEGIGGSTRVIEALLEVESFRQAWTAIGGG